VDGNQVNVAGEAGDPLPLFDLPHALFEDPLAAPG